MTELIPLGNELIYLAIPAILIAGLVHGAFGLGFLLDTQWLVPVAVIGLLIGTEIRKKFDETRYLKVLRAVLWIMSDILIVRFIYSYM